MDTAEILKNYYDYLKIGDIASDVLRTIGWWIVKLACKLIELLTGVTEKAFVLNNITENPQIKQYLSKFSAAPLIAALFAVSIIFIGYKVMFNKKNDLSEIVTNGMLALAIIMVLPVFVNKMSGVTNAGVGFATETTSSKFDTKFSETILKGNVMDMLVADKAGFPSDPKSLEPRINTDPLKININERVGVKMFGSKLNNKEVFKKKLVTDGDGGTELKKLDGGTTVGSIGKEEYYRYHVSFLYLIIQLGVVAVSLVLTTIKLVRMQFELVFHQLFATIAAPLDLDSGQKMKQIIKEIMSIFFVTILIAGLLQLYTLFAGICSDTGGVLGLIMLVASSFLLIDGPNLVEKILGIDAGIQSGARMIASSYMVGKTIGGVGKVAGGMAKKAGETGAKGIGKGIATGGLAGAAIKGVHSGMQEQYDKERGSMSNNGFGNSSRSNNGIYGSNGINGSSGSNGSSGTDGTNGSNFNPYTKDNDLNSNTDYENDQGSLKNNGDSLYSDMKYSSTNSSSGEHQESNSLYSQGGNSENNSDNSTSHIGDANSISHTGDRNSIDNSSEHVNLEEKRVEGYQSETPKTEISHGETPSISQSQTINTTPENSSIASSGELSSASISGGSLDMSSIDTSSNTGTSTNATISTTTTDFVENQKVETTPLSEMKEQVTANPKGLNMSYDKEPPTSTIPSSKVDPTTTREVPIGGENSMNRQNTSSQSISSQTSVGLGDIMMQKAKGSNTGTRISSYKNKMSTVEAAGKVTGRRFGRKK